MLIGIDRLDRLLGMYSSRRRNDDSLETLMLQHGIIVLVQTDTKWLQVLLGPFELCRVWRAGGDEFSTGSAFEEVQCMALAHATEAGAADF